ncbi:TetR/AcrR family transcriptional regulator [Bacillus sp. V59.32b]|uniref:TetR/AcrR family transcriptional regulator n=1 Tax=Bacillus sp. V59.32b TaxID=1758642 RepID=UPI000E3EC719|nr:TetR/AcrR family transcriptional regulator C-terminal domain-containing protein [Bacillus sp. V59.32b]RFU68552.1 TetR family transcriptional regulator [Bacillus sp. V59.32b]
MNTNTQKRTINQIIQTYTTLLHQRPFSEITVQDICDAALIHRSTFYRYFEDKYDLLNQVVRLIGQSLYERSQSHRTLFEELIEFVDENRQFFIHVTTNDINVDLFSELVKMSSNIMYANAERMDDPLSQKIRNSPHPKILCDFYSSGIIEVLKQWINKNYDYSKEKLIVIVNELF